MGSLTEIEVPNVQLLEGLIEGHLYLTMVGIGELGGDEYLFTGYTRCLNSNTDFGLVRIVVSSVNMAVP